MSNVEAGAKCYCIMHSIQLYNYLATQPTSSIIVVQINPSVQWDLSTNTDLSHLLVKGGPVLGFYSYRHRLDEQVWCVGSQPSSTKFNLQKDLHRTLRITSRGLVVSAIRCNKGRTFLISQSLCLPAAPVLLQSVHLLKALMPLIPTGSVSSSFNPIMPSKLSTYQTAMEQRSSWGLLINGAASLSSL